MGSWRGGKRDHEAASVALDLLRGATAELRPPEPIKDGSTTLIEVDGRLVAFAPRKRESPARIVVTLPDGHTAWYVASSYEQARATYEAALKILDRYLANVQ